MKNAIQLTINKLQALERTIELHSFNDEQNLEEALDEINSAMICIDELEDITKAGVYTGGITGLIMLIGNIIIFVICLFNINI